MLVKIQKWGNSQGLRLSKNLLMDAQLAVGDEVDISVKEGIIILAPVKKIHGRHNLQDLGAHIPASYHPSEVDVGDPVGKEIW